MRTSCEKRQLFRLYLWILSLALACAGSIRAQTCLTVSDMDQATRTAVESTAKHYFDMVARGDAVALKQNSISSLAAAFSGIEDAVKDNQQNLSGVQATPRPPFELKTQDAAADQHAEFLCGVFGKNGQTADSAVFVIPNLAAGTYAVATLDAPTAKGNFAVTFVLQQIGAEWKLGGLHVKGTQVNGHDANWFAERARDFQKKGQTHNAWFYFLEARDLSVPVSFMSTLQTDKLFDEMQSVKPSDLPSGGNTTDLPAAGRMCKLTTVFPLIVGKDFDLVVKYQADSVADSAKAFQDNTAVMKALLAKYPEFRDAFDGIVARAVAPSGEDYGSMLPMKEIK
jgi:hypothetical protein